MWFDWVGLVGEKNVLTLSALGASKAPADELDNLLATLTIAWRVVRPLSHGGAKPS